jgi:DNA-binding transcriptional regulator YhcF (GntR family)
VLDHDAPVPLHQQLAAVLRQQSTSAELTGRVPSILSLAQEHGAWHCTAAQALTTRKGYYIANSPPSQ